jgi:D-sedoheptulose 7-phosphate isomerase
MADQMSPEMTDFLYPCVAPQARDPRALLIDLAASADAKAAQSFEIGCTTINRLEAEISGIATEMVRRFTAGGRLFSFGNGGSATDAAAFAALLRNPPQGHALAARSLASDEATITALGNDVGFELIFSRQLIAYGRPGDMAVGFSTSGNSENVVRAFREARRRGMLTLGMAGHGGGQMAACGDIDHCLVVDCDSVHRIQETQDWIGFAIWEKVQAVIAAQVET